MKITPEKPLTAVWGAYSITYTIFSFTFITVSCPNVGVPEDGGDLTVEAATEGLPGGRRPQAEWDRQPQGITEGKRGKDGDAGQTE